MGVLHKDFAAPFGLLEEKRSLALQVENPSLVAVTWGRTLLLLDL